MSTSFRQFLREKDYNSIQTGLEYHNELNPKLWKGYELNERVIDKLEMISQEFIDFLGIPSSSVTDVIITGSNCSYNYSHFSDIDLHLIVNEKVVCKDCPGDFIEDCFKAKKNLWNLEHNIKIYNYDVELYAQPEEDNLIAAGIYSIRKRKWLKRPSANQPHTYDDISVKSKAGEIMDDIQSAIDDKVTDKNSLNKLKDKIKQIRKAGLEKNSEFSAENLSWKIVRNNGYLDKLDNYIKNLDDETLSLK